MPRFNPMILAGLDAYINPKPNTCEACRKPIVSDLAAWTNGKLHWHGACREETERARKAAAVPLCECEVGKCHGPAGVRCLLSGFIVE